MNSSIQTINTKEGLHADAISKTVPEKNRFSKKSNRYHSNHPLIGGWLFFVGAASANAD